MGVQCRIVAAFIIFYVSIVKVTAADVITPTTNTTSFYVDDHDESLVKIRNNNCACVASDCGCCRYIEWDAVAINGTLCTNVSYDLHHEYGISLTVTYNDFVIINETVSARNPPPLCFGEDIANSVKVEVCLRIYDIDIAHDTFHSCFEILGKLMRIKLPSIKLGCITTKLQRELEYLENNRISHLLLDRKIIEDLKTPNVIMV